MIHKPWIRNLLITVFCFAMAYTVYAMRGVLSPMFIALALAYVLDPVIDRFEKWNISRTWGIVILCGLIFLIFSGFMLYLVPRLISEVNALSEKVAELYKTKYDLIPEWKELRTTYPEIDVYKERAMLWLQENAGLLLKNISTGLATSFKSVGSFLGNLLGLIIIPVLTFYLLRDFDLMTGRITEMIPLKNRAYVVDLFSELNDTLSNFIKGQLLVALLLSGIYSVGLEIADCPASLLIGVIAGFANLIPYLGIAVGFLPAVLLTYFTGNPTWQVVTAALTFVVGQMLEGMVITPKIVGDSVGLHPVVVLVGLTIGGTYFGFLGMILALPVSAVIMVLMRRAYLFYVNSPFYREAALGETQGVATTLDEAAQELFNELPDTPIAPDEAETDTRSEV